jgi:hypothetical protein
VSVSTLPQINSFLKCSFFESIEYLDASKGGVQIHNVSGIIYKHILRSLFMDSEYFFGFISYFLIIDIKFYTLGNF